MTTDPLQSAQNKMVDAIMAASWEDNTIDGALTKLFLELDDQQRLELVASLAVFAWERTLERWGDPLSATLYLAEFRKTRRAR